MGGSLLQKRRVGQSDIYVSLLGLGTVKLGRQSGVKYPHPFQLPTDKEVDHLLSVASELGINLLDTAPAYGTSEERLGKALKGQRQQWVITTKVGEEFVDDASHFDFSAPTLCASVERSLKRLRTDYLDMVLVHSDGNDQSLIENDKVFTTLARLKKEGKLRAFGMSSKTIAGGLQAIDSSDVAMVTFNPDYTEERKVIAYAQQQKKGILIKKALASGHLSARDALQFVAQEEGITSIVIGTINVTHLRENVAYLNQS